MAIPAVTGHVDKLQFNQSIPLDQLFTNISADATTFDIRIRTGGGHLVDPNGNIYTSSDGVISNALTTNDELSQWHFVASSSDGLALIGFDAISTSSSSNVASAVLTGSTLVEGIDTPLVINGSNATAIKNAGYNFVVRYYSDDGSDVHDNQHSLTSTERLTLEAAQLQIAAVWENKYDQQQQSINAFIGAAGTNDATNAISQANTAGQEAGSELRFLGPQILPGWTSTSRRMEILALLESRAEARRPFCRLPLWTPTRPRAVAGEPRHSRLRSLGPVRQPGQTPSNGRWPFLTATPTMRPALIL